MALDGHENVPHGKQDAAEQHGFTHAEITVGNQATNNRKRIHEPGVGAEDVEAGLVGEEVILGQVEEQQELHSVE